MSRRCGQANVPSCDRRLSKAAIGDNHDPETSALAALGEPDRSSMVKPPGNDYPSIEYH